MSAKAIREFDGKCILLHFLSQSPKIASWPYETPFNSSDMCLARIEFEFPQDIKDDYNAHVEKVLDQVQAKYSWLETTKLVAKPDQLIKRRGKNGLLKLNATWQEARDWIKAHTGKLVAVEHKKGYLTNFIVENFVPHAPEAEFYVNIHSDRDGDWILFTEQGGIYVGDVDAKAKKILISLKMFPSREKLTSALLENVALDSQPILVDFISRLYAVYVSCHFTYLEINPLIVQDSTVYFLDLAAKLDQTAEFEAGSKWAIARASSTLGELNDKSGQNFVDHGPPMEWPAPFGQFLTAEEKYVAELDSKTGSSLKLTILNPEGRIWTLVAGGGASVVYADAIANAGYKDEMGNYGEYSGAPNETQTFEYAKTVFDVLIRSKPHPKGKILFIGGGVANFTNVAKTFSGIIKAIRLYEKAFKQHQVKIWVRRAGPNYEEGLRAMKALGEEIKLPIKVFGAETHISGIVPMALKA